MKNQQGTDDNPILLALSALADGESTDGQTDGQTGDQKDANDLTAEKLLLDTLQSNEMRAQWASMHVARDVLRAEYNSSLPGNFAATLRARIEHEEPDSSAVVPTSAKVVGLDKHRTRKSALKSKSGASEVWRSIAGLGVAASVAGAAFMFTQSSQFGGSRFNGDSTRPVQTADATQLVPAIRSGSTGTSGNTSEFQLSVADGVADGVAGGTQLAHEGTRWRTMAAAPSNSEIEQRLNMLLTNHLENASISSMQGMLSHSRVVGYDGVLSSE